jgi:3-keto-disaccharide hydrolase
MACAIVPGAGVTWILPLAALAACSAPESPEIAVAPAAGNAQAGVSGQWETLFDGADLSRLHPIGDANWEVVDGAVRADAGSGYLVSNAAYGDFDLELEFFVSPDANSGVFLRCSNPEDVTDTSCYEVNIFDTRPDQTYRTGGIVHIAAPSATLNSGGRWNSYAISADGPHLHVVLNDVALVDVEDDMFARGPIALQYGAGTVMFRNVRIRPH